MAKKHERTLARRMAVQALYQGEITGVAIDQLASTDTELPDCGALPSYAVELLASTQAHMAEIDDCISEASKNWKLSRMPVVDRAILRCAICEMLFIDDVPVRVAINEAVELAKAFGGEDESAGFVNGVLGRVARSGESGDASAPCSGRGAGPSQRGSEAGQLHAPASSEGASSGASDPAAEVGAGADQVEGGILHG